MARPIRGTGSNARSTVAGKHRHFYGQERGPLDVLAAFPTMPLLRRWIALNPERREWVSGNDPDIRAARAFERRTGIRVFLRPDMRRRIE